MEHCAWITPGRWRTRTSRAKAKRDQRVAGSKGLVGRSRRFRLSIQAPAGILRLSTPNLDWVWATHYRLGPAESPAERLHDCFQVNRAFHGWGHQFLYNRAALEAALKAAGFAEVIFQRYGESDLPEFKGIERHKTWEDTEDLPHVLIAEASGEAREEPLPEAMLREFLEDINSR